MSLTEREHIEESFVARRFGQVKKGCEELLAHDPRTYGRDAWLLTRLGIARAETDELLEGISTLLSALRASTSPEVDLWCGLGEAFNTAEWPACAAECYSAAALIDIGRRDELERRANECRQRSTSPQDMVISRVYVRAAGSLHQTVTQARSEIDALLLKPRGAGRSSTFLHVLRGDASFVPILRGSGGGYLLMHRGWGCVIDPGHGFIRNLREHTYGFGDIHSVIVTHAHDDHVMDLPALSSVLNKAGLEHPVALYLDETSYQAFRGHYLLASKGLQLQPILTPGNRRRIFVDGDYSLDMDVYRAEHEVPIRSPTSGEVKMGKGVGVGFRLGFPNREQYLLIPSDTGWCESVAEQYPDLRRCDVALLHVSSIEREEEWLRPKPKPQHMKLLGVIGFIERMKPRYVLLGEKGAELDDVWRDIANAVAGAFGNEVVVCASDLGTKVTFDGDNVRITGGYKTREEL